MATTETQKFIPIRDIRDGVVIREDGTYCGILLVSTVNFALKSSDEQEAILRQFQNLLNSLEVPTQIVIQSRKLNIQPYLEQLDALHAKQTNDLLRLQTKEYAQFIEHFTQNTNILTKNFFVVTTYTPTQTGKSAFPWFSKKKQVSDDAFDENRTQLQQRIAYVRNNIRSTGLRAVQLDTKEIIELFYLTFNPGYTEAPKIQ